MAINELRNNTENTTPCTQRTDNKTQRRRRRRWRRNHFHCLFSACEWYGCEWEKMKCEAITVEMVESLSSSSFFLQVHNKNWTLWFAHKHRQKRTLDLNCAVFIYTKNFKLMNFHFYRKKKNNNWNLMQWKSRKNFSFELESYSDTLCWVDGFIKPNAD